MYLSRVELDTESRNTIMALVSPQKLHGAIESAFNGERRRRLWRIDKLGNKLYVLIVSEDEPVLDGIVSQFGNGNAGEIRSYDALLNRLKAGSIWHFRLTANPTKGARDKNDPMARGVVTAHCSEHYQKKWLSDRAEKHGFSLTDDDFMVTETKWLHFRKRGSRPVTLLSVTYEGTLIITDPEMFSKILCEGIGRGKAYGLGMMTVIRGGENGV